MHLAELRQDAKQVIASVKRAGCDERERFGAAGSSVATVRAPCDPGAGIFRHHLRAAVLQADVKIDWPLRRADDEMIGFVSSTAARWPRFPFRASTAIACSLSDAGLGPEPENFQWLLDTPRSPKGAHQRPAWMNEYIDPLPHGGGFRAWPVVPAGDAAHNLQPGDGTGMNSSAAACRTPITSRGKLALCHKGTREPAHHSILHRRAGAGGACVNPGHGRGDTRHAGIFTIHNPATESLRDAMLRFTSVGLVQRRVSQLVDARRRIPQPVVRAEPARLDGS